MIKATAFAAFLCFTIASSIPAAEVSITLENGVRRVKTPVYEAQVAPDGCLTSLKIGGVEFINATISISRGTYFYSNGVIKHTQVEQTESSISAKCAQASIQYDFAMDSMTWTATNSTGGGMPFFMILDSTVSVMANDKGEFEAAPVKKDGIAASTWFLGKSKLVASGSSRLWPWEGGTQVWEATLAAGETRKITLQAGAATPDEIKKAASLRAPQQNLDADLAVLSPRNFQVFQRSSMLTGKISISGRVRPQCDKVEFHISGKPLKGDLPDAWKSVTLVPRTRAFFEEVVLPAGGWYKLELRATNGGKPAASAEVENVGIGEVFVGAGQSNSTNYGEEHLVPVSGMVSTFSGNDWRLAKDPQPGCHDNSSGGSFWPAFGDAMYEKYKVPIGFAVTGHGGTSVNSWTPKGELFNWMTTRILQLGPQGFRAVLWHQGESDVGMSVDEYATKLGAVIQNSKLAAGWEFPWFVAQVSYHNPNEPKFPNPRDAQKKLWDAGIALEGPDTDTLDGDNRDSGGKGIHLSGKGLRAHGKMWAEKVGPYVDGLLKE